MWRKEEPRAPGAPEVPTPPAAAGIPQAGTTTGSANATGSSLPVSPRAAACVTQGIRIKGEITGKEDLFVDGTLEGKLDLGNASLTIGPNGKLKADVSAREVIVRGHVDGKIEGTEKVQLWNSGRVSGEVKTERLSIEDGAVLRGKVEAGKIRAKSPDAKGSAAEKKPAGVDAASRAAVI